MMPILKGRICELQIMASEISFVIQGPTLIGQSSPCDSNRTIESIRTNFPGSEIILSTWEDSKLPNVQTDITILNEDPGPLVSKVGFVNNINRQIVSTLAGIRAAKRNYIFKIRSDIYFENNNFLRLVNSSLAEGVTLEKLVVTNLFVRNHLKYPLLFHVSDLVQFGTQATMLEFWNQGPYRHSDVFLDARGAEKKFLFAATHAVRQVPEQTLTISWISKKLEEPLDLRHASDGDLSLFKLWEQTLVKNLQLIPWEMSGLIFPKRFNSSEYSKGLILTQKQIVEIGKRVETGLYESAYSKFDRSRKRRAIRDPILDVFALKTRLHYPRLYSILSPAWRKLRRLFF